MRRFYISNETFKFNNNKYSINDVDELFLIFLKLWNKDTCTYRLQDKWTKDNPTVGECSITAFLIQDIFGGNVYGILLNDNNYHLFNVIDNTVIDLTSEQFNNEKLEYTFNYPQDRNVHFAKEEKYQRYLLLKDRFNRYMDNLKQ